MNVAHVKYATTNTLNYNTPFGTTTAADSTLFRERQIQIGFRFQF